MSFKTPILLIAFNRPEKIKLIFDILKVLKPEKLFISCDGPRVNNFDDKKLCEEVRLITKKINWKCKAIYKFSKKNKTCKINVIESINWFFKHNKEGIILEDDCLPNPSFFYFCETLLKKYRNNNKIMQINGHSNNQKSIDGMSYYFSKINTTWGWATWRKSWKLFDKDMSDYNKIKKKEIMKYFINRDISDWMNVYFEKSYKKIDNIWSVYWSFSILKNNGYCISPFKSLIQNIGFDGSGTSGKYNKFKLYSKIKANNFIIKKHPANLTYNKIYDENFFYNFVKKTDDRSNNGLINLITVYLKKILRIFNKLIKTKKIKQSK